MIKYLKLRGLAGLGVTNDHAGPMDGNSPAAIHGFKSNFFRHGFALLIGIEKAPCLIKFGFGKNLRACAFDSYGTHVFYFAAWDVRQKFENIHDWFR